MQEDEKVQEIFEELKQREEAQEKGVFRKLPQNTKMWFLAGIGIIMYAIWTGKIEKNNGMFILFVVGAIMYFSTYSEGGSTRPLTEQECRIKLWDQLKQQQQHPFGGRYQIDPRIKISFLPDGRLTYLEGKPRRWMLGVEFNNPQTHLTEKWAAICNPFNGALQGMKRLKGGMDDMDINDIQMIPDHKMLAEKRYHTYMGKYWDGRK